MEEKWVRRSLRVTEMTCSSCEMRIEKALKKINGVKEVKAVYSSAKVFITYDPNAVSLEKLIEAIEKLGYTVASQTHLEQKEASEESKFGINEILGIVIVLLAVNMIMKHTGGFNFMPQIDQSMSYGVLFVVGLLTSFHCIAMCGGINLSQCVSYKTSDEASKWSRLKPSFLYNLGRVLSYTLIGGIVGSIGSVISFSGAAKGIVAILSGIFMLIMGLNILNIFPWLRKFNPRMPRFFGNKIHSSKENRGPFYVGLLNGLMPCGPLQAMQLYALGTGSFIAGASSMFLFSLGTVPLMFGFGAISTLLTKNFTNKMMKFSGALVIFLGVIMINRGLGLSGLSVLAASSSPEGSVARVEGNMQKVAIELQSNSYAPIVVQKGVPVKFIINAKEEELNGCNGEVVIPKYNIQKELVPGENVIEFTPEEEGNIPYSCWMGMIRSNIQVVGDVSKISAASNSDSAVASAPDLSQSVDPCPDGAKATRFLNGKIPTDDITVIKAKNDMQEVNIKVNDEGYSPAIVVLQRNIATQIKFNTEKLNSCNGIVVFPEYRGQLSLKEGETETPILNAVQDFTFQCDRGMLHGYIKVVDNVDQVNLEEIKKEIAAYKPQNIGKRPKCH